MANKEPLVMMRVGQGNPEDDLPVNNERLEEDNQGTHPNVWFDANPGQKPPISLKIPTDEDMPGLRRTIKDGMAAGILDPHTVVSFLYAEFLKHPMQLTEDWTSFGRVIGVRGERITLENLLTINQINGKVDTNDGNERISEEQVGYLVLVVCFIYRLINTTVMSHRSLIIEAMQTHVPEKTSGISTNWHNWATGLIYWKQCAAYEILMAAIDMYLNRFPEHKYSCARMGTIISRFKDCSVLTATGYISNITGLDNNNLCGWIWTKKCADQFDRVTKAGQEYGKAYSYTPYFMSMRLAPKSAYSATLNPDLHFFFHAIGSALGELRSKNAFKPSNIHAEPLLGNVAVMCYGQSLRSTFGEQYYNRTKGRRRDFGDVEIGDTEIKHGFPRSSDPSKWLGFILDRGGLIPRNIMNQAVDTWNVLDDVRDNTMGAYLLDFCRRYESKNRPECDD
ncbi:MAG: nucleocapsid protein [Hangzhou tipula scripta rhabdovirus 1]|nr:MAG: nucleocapsid protein [Hangzhou tipula scripta rhabdovirus 1]